MVKFRNKNWSLIVTRNFSFFHNCLDASGNYFSAKKYGLVRNYQVFISKNGQFGYAFVDEKITKKYVKSIEKVCLNKNKLKKLESTYYRFGKKLWSASEKLENDLDINTFESFLKAYRDLAAGLVITTLIGKHMTELLFKELQKIYPKKSKQEIDILISNITYPKKNTPLTQSQLSLLKIGEKMQKNNLDLNNIKKHPGIYKKLKNYINKYFFVPVNFNEEPWSEKEIIEQLKNLMKKDCSFEIKEIIEQHKEKQKESKRLLKEINNKEIEIISNSIKIGTLLNEYRKYIFCRASLAYRPLFKKIADLYDLSSWKECWKLSPHEIIQLYFRNDKRIIKRIVERDFAGVVSANNKNGYYILNKKEIKPFLKELNISLTEKEINNYQIKGTIANPGKVKGKVKIILGKEDFYKFKDNNIIVTAMTSVDFVPIMKRASAFVTDEGGITSHASIVSREMNKPCIIGAKIATKVLKDGDLVEVDAERGVVKIIKKVSDKKN